MADIFLGYAREDRQRAELLATALETRGWTVFWDDTIPAGAVWREVIGRELGKARCVVVAWSTHSVGSQWVQEEAEDGQRRQILVPVLLDSAEPPYGFKGIQGADLAHWNGSESDASFRKLADAIARLIAPRFLVPPRDLAQAAGAARPKAEYQYGDVKNQAHERERSQVDALEKNFVGFLGIVPGGSKDGLRSTLGVEPVGGWVDGTEEMLEYFPVPFYEHDGSLALMPDGSPKTMESLWVVLDAGRVFRIHSNPLDLGLPDSSRHRFVSDWIGRELSEIVSVFGLPDAISTGLLYKFRKGILENVKFFQGGGLCRGVGVTYRMSS